MTHKLRAGLAFCLVDTRPVFLDVVRDRYFMIQGSLEAAFRAFVAGDDVPLESLGDLVCADILETAFQSADLPSPPTTVMARRSLIEEGRARRRPGPVATAKIAILLMQSRQRLRRSGFAPSIERLRARKRDRSGLNEMNQSLIESRASAFLEARSIFPAPANCLPDSLALLDHLYNHGDVADLVIGVRLDPYGAHCWIQLHDNLLNEAIDYANSFTPILVA